MIQFQFHDPCLVKNENLIGNLKTKLRMIKTQTLFVNTCENEFKCFETIRDPDTLQFKGLKPIKKANNDPHFKNVLVFDSKRNILLLVDKIRESVQFLDLNTNQRRIYDFHFGKITQATFYFPLENKTEKKYLIVGFESGFIAIYNLTNNCFAAYFHEHQGRPIDLLVNKNTDELIVICKYDMIQVWCLKTFKRLKLEEFYEDSRLFCLVNSEKRLGIGINSKGNIEFWNGETCDFIGTLKHQNKNSVNCVVCSDDSKIVISSSNKKIKVWNLFIHKVDSFWKSIGLNISKILSCGGSTEHKDKTVQLKFSFAIESPFDEKIEEIQFLGIKEILVKDVKNNLFVVDLLLEKMVWKSANFSSS